MSTWHTSCHELYDNHPFLNWLYGQNSFILILSLHQSFMMVYVVKSAHCNPEHYTVPKWVVEFDSVQTSCSNSGLLNSAQPICQACYHLPLQQNQ
jgi:hypothetical protein